MERRQFLKYTSLATAGFAFAACQNGSGSKTDNATAKKPDTIFGDLEKRNLTIGIMPVIDSAPIIIAKEKGFFEKYGLNVTIAQEKSWESLKESLIQGRLDAAHALYGMPLLAQLGAKVAPMVSLMTLNLNGNAITLSRKFWNAGIRPGIDYLNFQEFTDSYTKYIKSFSEPPSFGVVDRSAMGNYILRYWLATMNINPDRDVKLIEIPPTEMLDRLRNGTIEGYCVEEPGNQQAVVEEVGFTAYVDRDIWSGHPEKVLATMQPWIDANPVTTKAMVAAVLEACQYCDRTKNRLPITKIISDPKYLNTNVDYAKNSMLGKYNYGGFDQKSRIKQINDFNLFHFRNTSYLNKPDHANYPWQSHAVWLLTQMIRWNQIEQTQYPKDANEIIKKAYPLEIYQEVAKALKIPLPTQTMKVEPADVFIDKWAFNPNQPVEYLNNFEIRAN